MRGTHTRKRSRTAQPFRVNKKRKFVRRGRKSTNFTSQSGIGGGLRFKGKKVSRRRWNNMLWNDTLQSTHYRSSIAAAASGNTQATINTMSIGVFPAMRFGGNPFYTAPGGAIAPDAAQALPVFTGNVVLRGGVMGIRIVNSFDSSDANRSSVHGTVMLINTSKNYVAPTATSVYVGWDPTLVQDFSTTIGRILYRKNFLLRDAEIAVVEYKHRIKKYDVGDYVNDRNAYVWMLLFGNVDAATSRAVAYTTYYNCSFAADAV